MIRRLIRFLVVAMPLLVLAGCEGSANFRQARKAELRKDYDTALVYYDKALQEEPENGKYIIHEKLVRQQAAVFHIKRGEEFLKQNRQQDAIGEFQKAVGIDPTNQVAGQRLGQLLEQQAAAKKAREEAIKNALESQASNEYPSTVELQPLSQEKMKIHISADSRRVYETLGKLGNLNVAFTSDFQPRPITLDLTSVRIEDALRLAGYQTKSFWKAVTPNTILIIPDTPANRRDYQDEVLKTVYLSNPLAPADRTAITTALKQILGLQRIIDNPDSNAIVIRDTPERVAEAEKLIHDLDRGKAEILIEVAVVEADRNRVRDLGLTQVPTSPLTGANVAGIGFTATTQTTQVVNGTSTTLTVPGLPLNKLGKISTSDFSIVVPGAVANALLTDSHTHILQNPQVRVTDGQVAKVNIGSRVPYATGSFGLGGLGQTGSTSATGFSNGLLANTQFQYQDVGVNLELTPHLLADGEVNLHAKIDISSVGQTFQIGGLDEPSFNQRKIEHDIRLKEGEVNLLGGLIESSMTVSKSGLPGLSDLPFLRYFFSTTHTARVETEVLVMLTPRVIRLPEPAASASQAVRAEGGASTGGPEPGQIRQPVVPQRPGEQQPDQPNQPEPQFQGRRQLLPGSPQPAGREASSGPEQ
ncbi:MAG: secretin N-terminal domain-containing protein [Deltaproteobacteria bacterium]